MENCQQYRLLILDFGSQYTQLIARRIRELGVYCEIWSWKATAEQIRQFNAQGVILSGGPNSVHQADSPRAPDWLFHASLPILGICYGMQTMALQLGGRVEAAASCEFGHAQVTVTTPNLLTAECNASLSAQGEQQLDVWMSHGDKVVALPTGFTVLASTPHCANAMIANEARQWYGLQFHPEVTHTAQGVALFKQFVYGICGCQAVWTPTRIIDDSVAAIRRQVGEDNVILGLSGGVDSAVAGLLLHRAIGAKLICVFIDNGLLRLNEAAQVMTMFSDKMGLNIIPIAAEERFLSALAGVSDPEKKRKIIGRVFIEVFDEQAKKLPGVKWLAQGTIYPDIIESAASSTGSAHVIKSHHNVGGLPATMQLQLVEPLKALFKDEVRKIGLELGLPASMVYRHPFPGPGLGVRVIGEVKKAYCDLLRQADAIFIEELHRSGLYRQLGQAFCLFLPIRSVGVMGDGRRYDWVIALRAVETVDFMTAHWAHLPYELLAKVSQRIINEVKGISRVVYDISGKPPATIEWE